MGEDENIEKIKNGKYETIREKEYTEDDPRFKTRLERETEQRERFDILKAKEREERLAVMQVKKQARKERAKQRRAERLTIQKEKLEIAKTKADIAKVKALRRKHSASHTLVSTISKAKKRKQPQRTGTQQRVQKRDIIYIDGVPYIKAGQPSQHQQPKKKKQKKEEDINLF